MKTVSLKYHIWHYQVLDVKFQSLEQTHLQTKHHRWNIKRLVKVVPYRDPLVCPLKNTELTAITVANFAGEIEVNYNQRQNIFAKPLFQALEVSFPPQSMLQPWSLWLNYTFSSTLIAGELYNLWISDPLTKLFVSEN